MNARKEFFIANAPHGNPTLIRLEAVRLIDSFEVTADGATFRMAVHIPALAEENAIELRLSEWRSGLFCGVFCGGEMEYTRAVGEAAFNRLVLKKGAKAVRERIEQEHAKGRVFNP